MRPGSPTLAALLLAASVALAGCGSAEQPDRPGEPAADAASSQVETVSMRRTGGVTGDTRSWRVSGATPGAQRVFDAAEQQALRRIAQRPPQKVPCCDFYVYDIVVRFEDGRALHLRSTPDAHPAVTRLVDAILLLDAPTPDR